MPLCLLVPRRPAPDCCFSRRSKSYPAFAARTSASDSLPPPRNSRLGGDRLDSRPCRALSGFFVSVGDEPYLNPATMSQALQFRLHGSFDTEENRHSPVLHDSTSGLRIAASDIAREDGEFRFRLLLAFGFPDNIFLAFEDIRHSMVVAMQDPSSGASAAFQLIDPAVNTLSPTIENYRRSEAAPVAFMRGWTGVRVDVAVDAACPGLIVWANLHGFVSNTIRVATGAAQ